MFPHKHANSNRSEVRTNYGTKRETLPVYPTLPNHFRKKDVRLPYLLSIFNWGTAPVGGNLSNSTQPGAAAVWTAAWVTGHTPYLVAHHLGAASVTPDPLNPMVSPIGKKLHRVYAMAVFPPKRSKQLAKSMRERRAIISSLPSGETEETIQRCNYCLPV